MGPSQVNISHPELVSTLVKPGAAILTTLDASKVDLWHAATGIAGEGAELLEGLIMGPSTRDNVLEESGDLYFYIEQLLQNRQDIKIYWDEIFAVACTWDIDAENITLYAGRVAVYSGQVLDTVKKLTIYNKPLDVILLQGQLIQLAKNLVALDLVFDITREAALAYNIAKLSKRYEGIKYSDEAAQKRADKA